MTQEIPIKKKQRGRLVLHVLALRLRHEHCKDHGGQAIAEHQEHRKREEASWMALDGPAVAAGEILE